jgi:Taurine catabolism dioxygenase TauD, TfdA family.
MFHLLSHTGSGGKSLLVDGFAAARILQKEAPDSYDVLARKKIRSHASGNEGISIQPFTAYPVFNHASDCRLYQIRWNSSDRATMDDWDDDKLLEQWYEAAWKWSEILRRPGLEYWEQLQPGKPLSMFHPSRLRSANKLPVLDNWRVLHGRSAFGGRRRICGGYSMLATAEWQLDSMANLVTVNYDDYMSRYRMTNIGREGVLQRL